jgi:ubiquitin-protein ligase
LKTQLPEALWSRRLALEYKLMRENEPTFDIVNNQLTHYRGVIIGEGLYEGGFFKVEIIVPRTFPYTPPDVIWWTRIWHPNFTDEVPARICESIFKNDWSPSLHLFSVVEALRNLLNNPNPDDPLNTFAAAEMKYRPDIFEARVRAYIELYARAEYAFQE